MTDTTGDAQPASARIASAEGLRSLDWPRLLRLAGAADGLAVLVVAALLGDLEAAVTGLGFVVAMALLRLRNGGLGVLAIGLLSTNVLAWMALGAYSNLVSGDGLPGLVIPALLTTLSLVGVVAALGTWLSRRRTTTDGAGPLVTVALAGVLLATVLILGALRSSGAEATAQAGDLVLATANLRFTKPELSVVAGQVAVVVKNEDLFWHTFTIDELGVDLRVPVSAERRVTFNAAPGRYSYYCRVPGHDTIMRGTLRVN
ncbi:MAG: cupredoxin domain-containing protein [Actinomycetota bacterium]|jgi:plastocyanin|nr:cupredoxin domain-containing protein [Euzebyaceae bacterium]MDQ3451217.1 cupredoxin domain-containing protein [Actinomycetota bacterium]